MYSVFRQFCERLLRIPPEPEAPPGDESSMRLFQAAPNFYRYLLVLWAIVTVISFLVLSVFLVAPIAGFFELRRQGSAWAALLLLIPFAVFGVFGFVRLFRLAVLRLEYEKRWYLVTDRSLRIREGVINVREMTVTFANIQNISVSQGPIQRLLGIADLQVDTAGGGGAAHGKQPMQNLHTAFFRGIDNVTEVRDLIQERVRHLKDSGLGDHEELAARGPASSWPAMLTKLREVRAEAKALREALIQSNGDSQTQGLQKLL